jgi:hypothetical protein
MSRIVPGLVALFALVSSASAQILYQPVQYQYESSGTYYYYGGSNPAVHQVARELYDPGTGWGRVNGYVFASGDINTFRAETKEPTRVYSDATRTLNAGLLGMTPDDARDEAYANAARYFAKRDLVNLAVPMEDGSYVVPAHATSSSIRVSKSDGTMIPQGPATRTVTEPRPLLIIPKDQLIKPIPAKQSDKSMAAAN